MKYSTYCSNKGIKSRAFLEWVDKVEKLVGYELLELPDQMYYVSFERGVGPGSMARMIRYNTLRYLNT